MKTIQLKLYKGKELLYDKNGNVKNENQPLKLTDGVEWLNYLKYIKAQQLCKVELIGVFEANEPVKDVSFWVNQLQVACNDGLECEILVKSEQNEPKTDREVLKAQATAKGISFAKNISTPELEKLVNA